MVVTAIAITAAALTLVEASIRPGPSDFAQTRLGLSLFLSGHNPWAAWPYKAWDGLPLFYPLPALLVAIPFAFAGPGADAVFMACSAGLLAWALTRETVRNPQLLVFASAAFLFAVQTVQWSLLVTAAALMPVIGWLIIVKPTLGLALMCAYPSRRAVIGSALLAGFSILLAPWWVSAWWAVLPQATHVMAPLALPGGWLVLAALAKWRRPEARLLVALACVPHAPVLYEAVPLFLVVRRWWEGALLVAMTPFVWLLPQAAGHYPTLAAYTIARGTWQVWLLYLPCLAMVLWRPNVWPQQPVERAPTVAPIEAPIRV